jgi:hypothetical protein
MTWDVPKGADRESLQLRQFVSPVGDNGQRRQASLRVIQGTSLRLGGRASCASQGPSLRIHNARGKFAAWRDVVVGLPDHGGSLQGRRAQPGASPGGTRAAARGHREGERCRSRLTYWENERVPPRASFLFKQALVARHCVQHVAARPAPFIARTDRPRARGAVSRHDGGAARNTGSPFHRSGSLGKAVGY